MPVSEKMWDMLTPLVFTDEGALSFAQSVIDAAWIRFDPDDPSTWPKSEYAPSGEKWLLRMKDKTFVQDEWRGHTWNSVWDGAVIRYADPADLMPSFIGD